MGDDNTNQKKRKSKWTTSYSDMSIFDAEKRLGFMMQQFAAKEISVERMLAVANDGVEGEGPDAILNLQTKKEVYNQIVRHLRAEGYPTESDADFKEANINDLVYAIIIPIIFDFSCQTGLNVRLLREKEIISVDNETGGYEEFVMVDFVSVTERNFVLVVEAKRSSVGQAMKQCLLAMKDMRDNNGYVGEVHGFVTTGGTWRMIRYDGTCFELTESMEVLFGQMDGDKERWMKDYSVLVDCMYAALSNGGIVKKDVVV